MRNNNFEEKLGRKRRIVSETNQRVCIFTCRNLQCTVTVLKFYSQKLKDLFKHAARTKMVISMLGRKLERL